MWVKDIQNRRSQGVQLPGMLPLSPGTLTKALGSEDLAIIFLCGHSDTLSSKKIKSAHELLGLHFDFQEGLAWGPMGLARLWKQRVPDSALGFAPHWLGDKRDAA